MNKSQLIAQVGEKLMTSRSGAARVVDAVLAGIQQGLREDRSVTITGFGTFEVKERRGRVGRNPHTGMPITIAPGRRVGFRVGKSLRQSV